jgi:nucleoside-diphosphate-sugar epimerase
MYSSTEEIVMQRLDGRVALVTGAASGIGRAIAVRLGTEGAAVVVTDLASDDASFVNGLELYIDGGFMAR